MSCHWTTPQGATRRIVAGRAPRPAARAAAARRRQTAPGASRRRMFCHTTDRAITLASFDPASIPALCEPDVRESVGGLYATLAVVALLCAWLRSACARAAASPRAGAAARRLPGRDAAAAVPATAVGDRPRDAVPRQRDPRAPTTCTRCAPTASSRKVAGSQVASMVRWDYFADVGPSGQTPLSLVGVTRYPAHTAGYAVGQNIAWGTGALREPRTHRRRMDGLAAAPRDHPDGRLPRRRRRGDARRCPGVAARRAQRRDLRDGVRRPPLLRR